MSTTTRPGPSSIDHTYTGTSTDLGELWNRRDYLVELHAEHKERVRQVTEVVNGNWYEVWPTLTNTAEAPSVANIVEMGVNHWASVGGAMLPSVRVPVDLSDNRSQAKRGARKRERRLRELIKESQLADMASLFWGDYAGAGTAILGAWCDFSKPPAERNPYIMRFDPRHTYPTVDERGNVTELLVARKVPKIELANRWPDAAAVFKNTEGDVEEWFWYRKDSFCHYLVDVSKTGKEKNRHMKLAEAPNPLGFVPAVEVVRPSFDGQRRGLFDQTLHLLRTMHRLMILTIASTEENAFPAILEYDTINPEDFGPGATITARSAEARLERVGPATHFDIKDLVARLAEDARSQAAFPQQLTGDPGASIASARAISASMGQLDARLALAHRQFEVGFSKLFGFLLAMDETFCDTDRTIIGDHRDAGQNGESWKPSRDINGAWVAEATYGIGAGSDPANVEVRLSMHLANGIISKETYRAQLPFLEDPEREPLNQMREVMRDALMSGIIQQASQGQLDGAVKALELLRKDDVDFDSVVGSLVEFLQNPEPEGQPGQGDPALAALQGAESLARGGIPGSAEQAPAPPGPESLGLPPLQQIMEQDSRQVV